MLFMTVFTCSERRLVVLQIVLVVICLIVMKVSKAEISNLKALSKAPPSGPIFSGNCLAIPIETYYITALPEIFVLCFVLMSLAIIVAPCAIFWLVCFFLLILLCWLFCNVCLISFAPIGRCEFLFCLVLVLDKLNLCMVSGWSFGLGGDFEWIEKWWWHWWWR